MADLNFSELFHKGYPFEKFLEIFFRENFLIFGHNRL